MSLFSSPTARHIWHVNALGSENQAITLISPLPNARLNLFLKSSQFAENFMNGKTPFEKLEADVDTATLFSFTPLDSVSSWDSIKLSRKVVKEPEAGYHSMPSIYAIHHPVWKK
jgi:hypothetical protein